MAARLVISATTFKLTPFSLILSNFLCYGMAFPTLLLLQCFVMQASFSAVNINQFTRYFNKIIFGGVGIVLSIPVWGCLPKYMPSSAPESVIYLFPVD